MNTLEKLEASAVSLLGELDELSRNYGVPRNALFAYAENLGLEIGEAIDWVEQCAEDYLGEFDNYGDLGAYFVEELGAVDVSSLGDLVYYFDYEKFGRDLELGGDVWSSDNYYFTNR